MPERKPSTSKREIPTTTPLRRSPRFLQQNQIVLKNPSTPKPAPRKTHLPDSFFIPLNSTITRRKSSEITQNGAKKSTEQKNSGQFSLGLRRSARLNREAGASKIEKKLLDLSKECLFEKRVTRSSVRGSKYVDNGAIGSVSTRDSSKRVIVFPKEGKKKVRANLLDLTNECLFEKRVTRSSVRANKRVDNDTIGFVSGEDSSKRVIVFLKEVKKRVRVNLQKKCTGTTKKRVTRSNSGSGKMKKVVLEDLGKARLDNELCKSNASKRVERKCEVKGENCGKTSLIGGKRKREQVEEESEIVRGWSKEQELSLQKAYFSVKPTPHFWKKVAKMVPGKSAEECFARIHSDHLTPTPSRKRSKQTTKKQPFSISSINLLTPISEKKTKKIKPRKKNTLLAHKTVRHLLQKQQSEDQDYQADFFSVFEQNGDSPSLNFQGATPLFASCSSARKKQFSRLMSPLKNVLASPPVLKPIKNKALHEKHIDQLHRRDAKRKAKASRNYKGKNDEKGSSSHLNKNAVKVSKDALLFEAQDAINQFRNLQSTIIDEIDDDDDDGKISDEDECEDEF